MRFANRPRAVVITTLLLLGLVGVSVLLTVYANTAAPREGALAQFEENGVTVAIGWEVDRAGQTWLIGAFTPMLEHFHLYSKDLPRNGINGRGRPTLLEVSLSGSIATLGALVDDPPAIEIYSLIQQSIPVYPDGPVTLRMPIALNSAASAPTELSVTYMACSLETCFMPVVDKRISVMIPAAR
jgi:hypothetical protein